MCTDMDLWNRSGAYLSRLICPRPVREISTYSNRSSEVLAIPKESTHRYNCKAVVLYFNFSDSTDDEEQITLIACLPNFPAQAAPLCIQSVHLCA